ncbi:MAG: hypothetical protein ACJ763_12675 [Bdellovibrionia bacterium]
MVYRSLLAFLIVALAFQFIGMPEAAFAQESIRATRRVSADNELESEIAERLMRVREFGFIEQEAKKLGVRAWLFGGTAAAYAHYVKWDLDREKGDPRHQPERFDYDYSNIYRSTQDLDIVVDGTPDQAYALQKALMEKFPHKRGRSSAWEVRTLTQEMEDQQAILNNPDFINQHTDSNSTGLIELTTPKKGESVVRDVKGWKSKQTQFLKDVQNGTIHYYFSPLHETTQLAKEGRNIPIMGAIRFLTKAFQYGLKISLDDEARIRKVIQQFNPRRDIKDDYVESWIEKNGKKLIQNALDIEHAWNTLDDLGLRNKLMAIHYNVDDADSLAWWMNKEPLRTQPVGKGKGRTAKQLGIDVIAHDTKSFPAFESITKANSRNANVFVSRNDTSGEMSAFDDGFYTKVGPKGTLKDGMTIRFQLDPKAREGTDFDYIEEHDFVVVKNKAAIKVIPESVNVGPVGYFQMIAKGELNLDDENRGLRERLRKRVESKLSSLTDDEEKQLFKILKKEIQRSKKDLSTALLEWFSFPQAVDHPELVRGAMKDERMEALVIRKVLSDPKWVKHPELVQELVKKGSADFFLSLFVLSKPEWTAHPELVEGLLKNGTELKAVQDYVLSKPYWQDVLRKGASAGCLPQDLKRRLK